jgi:hypothetical protein
MRFSSKGRRGSASPVISSSFCQFVVVAAEFRPSKNKREMAALTILVTDSAGCSHLLNEYFGEWNTDKVEAFFEATNLMRLLDTEVEANDFVNARGRCEIGVNFAPGPFMGRGEIKRYLSVVIAPEPPMLVDDIEVWGDDPGKHTGEASF